MRTQLVTITAILTLAVATFSCSHRGSVETATLAGMSTQPKDQSGPSVENRTAAHTAATERRWYLTAAWNEAAAVHAFQEAVAAHEAEQARLAELRRVEAEAEAEAERQRQSDNEQPAQDEPPSYGSGRCGGDLPPCAVLACESGGNIHAQNPTSSASGKWQFIQSTANAAARAIGRPDLVGSPASSWPESVQDQAAAWLYAGGAGRGHWSC